MARQIGKYVYPDDGLRSYYDPEYTAAASLRGDAARLREYERTLPDMLNNAGHIGTAIGKLLPRIPLDKQAVARDFMWRTYYDHFNPSRLDAEHRTLAAYDARYGDVLGLQHFLQYEILGRNGPTLLRLPAHIYAQYVGLFLHLWWCTNGSDAYTYQTWDSMRHKLEDTYPTPEKLHAAFYSRPGIVPASAGGTRTRVSRSRSPRRSARTRSPRRSSRSRTPSRSSRSSKSLRSRR
jgi:hypothetical protein